MVVRKESTRPVEATTTVAQQKVNAEQNKIKKESNEWKSTDARERYVDEAVQQEAELRDDELRVESEINGSKKTSTKIFRAGKPPRFREMAASLKKSKLDGHLRQDKQDTSTSTQSCPAEETHNSTKWSVKNFKALKKSKPQIFPFRRKKGWSSKTEMSMPAIPETSNTIKGDRNSPDLEVTVDGQKRFKADKDNMNTEETVQSKGSLRDDASITSNKSTTSKKSTSKTENSSKMSLALSETTPHSEKQMQNDPSSLPRDERTSLSPTGPSSTESIALDLNRLLKEDLRGVVVQVLQILLNEGSSIIPPPQKSSQPGEGSTANLGLHSMKSQSDDLSTTSKKSISSKRSTSSKALLEASITPMMSMVSQSADIPVDSETTVQNNEAASSNEIPLPQPKEDSSAPSSTSLLEASFMSILSMVSQSADIPVDRETTVKYNEEASTNEIPLPRTKEDASAPSSTAPLEPSITSNMSMVSQSSNVPVDSETTVQYNEAASSNEIPLTHPEEDSSAPSSGDLFQALMKGDLREAVNQFLGNDTTTSEGPASERPENESNAMDPAKVINDEFSVHLKESHSDDFSATSKKSISSKRSTSKKSFASTISEAIKNAINPRDSMTQKQNDELATSNQTYNTKPETGSSAELSIDELKALIRGDLRTIVHEFLRAGGATGLHPKVEIPSKDDSMALNPTTVPNDEFSIHSKKSQSFDFSTTSKKSISSKRSTSTKGSLASKMSAGKRNANTPVDNIAEMQSDEPVIFNQSSVTQPQTGSSSEPSIEHLKALIREDLRAIVHQALRAGAAMEPRPMQYDEPATCNQTQPNTGSTVLPPTDDVKAIVRGDVRDIVHQLVYVARKEQETMGSQIMTTSEIGDEEKSPVDALQISSIKTSSSKQLETTPKQDTRAVDTVDGANDASSIQLKHSKSKDMLDILRQSSGCVACSVCNKSISSKKSNGDKSDRKNRKKNISSKNSVSSNSVLASKRSFFDVLEEVAGSTIEVCESGFEAVLELNDYLHEDAGVVVSESMMELCADCNWIWQSQPKARKVIDPGQFVVVRAHSTEH